MAITTIPFEIDEARLAQRPDDALVFLRDVAVAIHRVEPVAPGELAGALAISGPTGSISLGRHVPSERLERVVAAETPTRE